MAYADTIRASTARMNDVATLIEGNLVTYGEAATSSLISTTATSPTDYTGASVTITVGTGDLVLVNYSVALSHGTSGVRCDVNLYEDASALTSSRAIIWTSRAVLTTGIDFVASNYVISKPAAGSHTYKVRWHTASGTVYSGYHQMTVFLFQNT